MKPRKCSVFDCLSDARRKEDEGVTFHRLPRHRDIRERWMMLSRIDRTLSKRVLYACSRHFLRADFCHTKGKKYTLLPSVEPSIFSWNKKVGCQSNSITQPKIAQPMTESRSSYLSFSFNTLENETNAIEKSNLSAAITENNSSARNAVDNKRAEGPEHEGAAENKIESSPLSTILQTKLCTEHYKPDAMSSFSSVDQKPRSIITPTGTIVFLPYMKIEALDCQQNWSPATIVEIDCDEDEVLVHFDEYSSKYDEWLSMSSAAIRAPKTSNEYEVGERCLACWTDLRKFPAKVINVIDKDTCEVEFDDGFRKTLRTKRMSKPQSNPIHGESHSSPLFDPVKGSKQERRDKKRKINVTELFGKRPRGSNVIHSDNKLDGREKETSSTEGIMTVIPGLKPGMTGNEDWIIKWIGNVPVGEEATLEFEEGPKNTIKVPDSRLPDKWEKHFAKRSTTGKWEILIINPEGTKFRSLKEIRHYYTDLNELPKPLNRFDFTHMRPMQKTTKSRGLGRKRASSGNVLVQDSTLEQDIKEMEPEPETQSSDRPCSTNLSSQSPQFKILHIEDSYRCPIDGCGKNFRRENLAQMHIKHYHPKQFKLLDSVSTPNVADLAYARTVNDSLEKTTDNGITQSSRISKGTEARSSSANGCSTSGSAWGGSVKQKDAEIIRLLMNKQPSDCADQSVVSGIVGADDLRLKDLLNSSSTSGLPGRPSGSGIRTLLPVVRDDIILDGDSAKRGRPVKRKIEKNIEGIGSCITNVGIDNITFTPDLPEESQSSQEFLTNLQQQPSGLLDAISSDIIIEGGQIIRLVRMKQEEIINCACHYTEEDGLMIQCEVCLCWQHATCFNIYTETQVPDNYICHICRNPIRLRPSRAWYYDQEWLKHGRLPHGKYRAVDSVFETNRHEQLRRSHDLTGGLLELRDFMRTLRLKIKISENKNHPKLYLWSKPWPKDFLPEKSTTSAVPKAEDSSMLFNLLKNAKDEQLIHHTNLQLVPKHHITGMPTPEIAIENSDCRLNLLEHIDHCQNLAEERLDDFARFISDIDNEDMDIFVTKTEIDNCHIRETIQMVRRDLETWNDLSRVTTF